MSSQARILRDDVIEIQTDADDRLILTTDEARIFRTEIENALFTIFSDDQTDPEIEIPIVVNDVSFSIEDAEQLVSRLDDLLSHEGRGPEQKID